MEEIVSVNTEELIDALRIWSGWGGMYPRCNDLRLVQQVGQENADILLPIIKKLQKDFYMTDAYYTASDLKEMAKLATLHFRDIHPELSAEVGDIFAWCYTFDFK